MEIETEGKIQLKVRGKEGKKDKEWEGGEKCREKELTIRDGEKRQNKTEKRVRGNREREKGGDEETERTVKKHWRKGGKRKQR